MKYVIEQLSILSGLEISVPLNYLTIVSNNVNFQLPLKTLNNDLILNSLLGFVTYKSDRYLDALDYQNEKKNGGMPMLYLSESKINNFENIIKNEKYVQFVLFNVYLTILIYTIHEHETYYLPFLISTFNYKNLKKELPYFKSIYISTLWSLCTSILPFLHYSNLNVFDNNNFLPIFFNIFATTNLADIKDIKEDKKNKINTLPIILGKDKTIKIITFASILSTYFFVNNDFFEFNILNNLFICSNIIPLIPLNFNISFN